MPSAIPDVDGLFGRVAAILEEARSAVVRSVNTHMVLAYWHIGREIVESLQGGDDRAEYGRAVIDRLSERLTKRYGPGFSTTNLRYFRNFHQVYAERAPAIRHTVGGEFEHSGIRHPAGGVLQDLALAVKGQDYQSARQAINTYHSHVQSDLQQRRLQEVIDALPKDY